MVKRESNKGRKVLLFKVFKCCILFSKLRILGVIFILSFLLLLKIRMIDFLLSVCKKF